MLLKLLCGKAVWLEASASHPLKLPIPAKWNTFKADCRASLERTKSMHYELSTQGVSHGMSRECCKRAFGHHPLLQKYEKVMDTVAISPKSSWKQCIIAATQAAQCMHSSWRLCPHSHTCKQPCYTRYYMQWPSNWCTWTPSSPSAFVQASSFRLNKILGYICISSI